MEEADQPVSHLGLDYWLARPFSEVFEQMGMILQNTMHADNFEECNTCIDTLLTCLCVNGTDENENVGDTGPVVATSAGVAKLVKMSCLRHPNICSTLFVHILSITDPMAFINILPSVMVVCPAYKMNEAFDALLALSENNQYTIPILSVLLDIDLSLVRKQKVVQLVEDILCSTGEADFPPLFKLIFANLRLFSGSSVIRKLRYEISALSVDSVVVLLFENMVETMPYFSPVARMLLSDILLARSDDSSDTVPVSLFDVVVVLIGFSMPACSTHAQQVWLAWWSAGIFPRDHFVAIMERRATHEIWNRLMPSLRKMLSWLFASVATTVQSSFSRTELPGKDRTKILVDLYVSFYNYVPDHRESTLAFLLQECFSLNGTTPVATASLKQINSYRSDMQSRKNNILNKSKKLAKVQKGVLSLGSKAVCLAPIGSVAESWSSGGSVLQSALTPKAVISFEYKLSLALEIMENIFDSESASSDSLRGISSGASAMFLSYLLDRFRPSAHEAGSRHRLKLPPPFILFRVLECFVKCDKRNAARVGNARAFWESTTMITVQKLISYLGSYMDHTLLQLFHLIRRGKEDNMKEQGNGTRVKHTTPAPTPSLRIGSLSNGNVDVLSALDEELVVSVLDNFSAQGVGILFATSTSLDFADASIQIEGELRAVATSSSSASSSSHRVVDNPPRSVASGHDYSEMSAVATWISQSTANFTDSSVFYAVDYFVCCLQHVQRNALACEQNVLFTQYKNLLISSSELVLQALFKNCRFLHRRGDIVVWKLHELSAECVDMAVRMTASSTSWGTVDELSSLMVWIVNVISKFLYMLSSVKGALDTHVTIAHSIEYLPEIVPMRTKPRHKNNDTKFEAIYPTIDKPINWPSCDGEYGGADVISDAADSVSINLRLAWEHCLTASVLSRESSMPIDTGESSQRVLLVLANISWSREFLRLVTPFIMETINVEHKRRERNPTSVGSKRRRDDTVDCSIDGALHIRNMTVLRKNMGMECHIKQLQRCLDRLTIAIPAEGLEYILLSVLDPISGSASDERQHVTYSTIHDASRLFSAGGFAAVCAYVSTRIPPITYCNGFLSQTTLQTIDSFVSRNECTATSKFNGSLAEQFESTCGLLISRYPVFVKVSEDMLLSGVPNICAKNKNQKATDISGNADKQHSVKAFSELFGDVVTYSMRSALLCSISLLARHFFASIWKSCEYNTDNFLFSEYFAIFCESEHQPCNTTAEGKLLRYMTVVEESALESRDSLVGLSNFTLLLDIAGPCLTIDVPHDNNFRNRSKFHCKLISLAWKLSCGLQSTFTVLSMPKYAHACGYVPVGKGIMFNHIYAFLSDNSLLKTACTALNSQDADCSICYADLMTLLEDVGNSKLQVEEYTFAKFWSLYWAMETPLHRVLGTHIAISAIFTILLSPVHPKSRGKESRQTESPSAVFSRMDHENLQDYFRIVSTFFPVLFLGASPDSHKSEIIGNGKLDSATVVNPYFTFSCVSFLFVSTVREYSRLLKSSSGIKLGKASHRMRTAFFTQGLDTFCKMCKNTLVAMSVAINRSVEWRSGVSMSAPPTGNMSPLEAVAEHDKGDLSYLIIALEWALRCSQEVSNLVEAVKHHAVVSSTNGEKRNTKSAVKHLPLLSQTSEKIMSHVNTVLKRHGSHHASIITEEVVSKQKAIFAALSPDYLSALSKFSSLSFSEATWHDLVSTNAAFDQCHLRAVSDASEVDEPLHINLSWHVPKSDDDIVGWGAYDSVHRNLRTPNRFSRADISGRTSEIDGASGMMPVKSQVEPFLESKSPVVRPRIRSQKGDLSSSESSFDSDSASETDGSLDSDYYRNHKSFIDDSDVSEMYDTNSTQSDNSSDAGSAMLRSDRN